MMILTAFECPQQEWKELQGLCNINKALHYHTCQTLGSHRHIDFEHEALTSEWKKFHRRKGNSTEAEALYLGGENLIKSGVLKIKSVGSFTWKCFFSGYDEM